MPWSCYTTTMPTLKFNNRLLELRPYENVLDCLLRHGEVLPYACKAGMCQACLIKAVDTCASIESQQWLRKELTEKGFTLACRWYPEEDVAACLPSRADFSIPCTLTQMSPLNSKTMLVTLIPADRSRLPSYHPGQFFSLSTPTGITRPYSTANDYSQELKLDFHISATSHGEFTRWLFYEAKLGDEIRLQGPGSQCHYDSVRDSQSTLWLGGNGTGLAPLLAISKDALRQGHQAEIHLYHGARDSAGLYLIEELISMSNTYANFHYHPVLKEAEEERLGANIENHFLCGDLQSKLKKALSLVTGTGLRQATAFFCGSPTVVHSLHKMAYLAGIPPQRILHDPFTDRPVSYDTSNLKVESLND